MSILFWNGIPTTTQVVVVARSTTNGDCYLTINGVDGTAVAADTAVLDGHVRLEFDGLSPDTKCTYTLTTPDGTATGQTRTFPASGSPRIVNYSCEPSVDLAGAREIARLDPHVVISTGDESYAEDVYFNTVTQAIDVEQHYAYARYRRSGNVKGDCILHRFPFGAVVDDHDFFYNDGVDNLATLQAYAVSNRDASYATMTQGQFDTAVANAMLATQAISLGNPVNTDPDAETDAFYFRFECGDVEVFVLSQVVSSPSRFRPLFGTGVDVSLCGDDQIAWLKAQLTASTKAHKLILSPKSILQASSGNPDTWYKYNDLYPLLTWVHANVTGVMWMGGDFHSAGLFCSEAGIAAGNQGSAQGLIAWNGNTNLVNGHDFDCVSIVNSSVGRYGPATNSGVSSLRADVRDADAASVGNNDVTRYSCNKWNGRHGVPHYLGFGLADIDGTALRGQFINLSGNTLFSARVEAGSNKLSFKDIAISV